MKKVAEFSEYIIYSEIDKKYPDFTVYTVTKENEEGVEILLQTLTFYEAVRNIQYWFAEESSSCKKKKKHKITVDIHLSDD